MSDLQPEPVMSALASMLASKVKAQVKVQYVPPVPKVVEAPPDEELIRHKASVHFGDASALRLAVVRPPNICVHARLP